MMLNKAFFFTVYKLLFILFFLNPLFLMADDGINQEKLENKTSNTHIYSLIHEYNPTTVNKTPIILVPGIFMKSSVFNEGGKNSISYSLIKEGFDVWRFDIWSDVESVEMACKRSQYAIKYIKAETGFLPIWIGLDYANLLAFCAISNNLDLLNIISISPKTTFAFCPIKLKEILFNAQKNQQHKGENSSYNTLKALWFNYNDTLDKDSIKDNLAKMNLWKKYYIPTNDLLSEELFNKCNVDSTNESYTNWKSIDQFKTNWNWLISSRSGVSYAEEAIFSYNLYHKEIGANRAKSSKISIEIYPNVSSPSQMDWFFERDKRNYIKKTIINILKNIKSN